MYVVEFFFVQQPIRMFYLTNPVTLVFGRRLLVTNSVVVTQRRMAFMIMFLLTSIVHIHLRSSSVQTHSPDYIVGLYTHTRLYRQKEVLIFKQRQINM